MFSPLIFINTKIPKTVKIDFDITTMKIRYIKIVDIDKEFRDPHVIYEDYLGEIFINMKYQQDTGMEVATWSIILGVDKYLYLVKIPIGKKEVFSLNKQLFKQPHSDIKAAMDLITL